MRWGLPIDVAERKTQSYSDWFTEDTESLESLLPYNCASRREGRSNGSIARENAFVQKVFGITLDGELEIDILKSVRNALLKRSNQVVHCPNFHDPFDLPSRREAQLYGSNDSKDSVSSVNQSE